MLVALSLYAKGITLPEHFSAEFIQKITNTKGKAIFYRGKVRFSQPALMKWEYRKPTQKEVCTDAEALTVVDHDLEQVSIYLISKKFNLSKIVKQAKKYRDNVYVTRYQGKQYTIQVDSSGQLQSIAYYDDLDNKVQIVFKEMHYGNKPLKRANMLCPAPKFYDEIRG